MLICVDNCSILVKLALQSINRYHLNLNEEQVSLSLDG